MSLSDNEFKAAFRTYPTGVTIVTANFNDKLIGLTVSSVTSLSLHPPMLLFCLENHFSMFDEFIQSNKFAINILSFDQHEISQHFAQAIKDKFNIVDYSLSEQGLPLLAGCVYHIECDITQTIPQGDHTIICGSVTRCHKGANKKPLTYLDGKYNNL